MIDISVKYDRVQRDGSRRVKIVATDGTNEYSCIKSVGADWSLASEATWIEEYAISAWKKKELSDMPNKVLSGLTPEELLSSTTYATTQEIVREGIRYGLEVEDVTSVALMQGIYTYLQSTFTDETLSAYTGYTLATIQAFNARMEATFTTGSVNDQILLIESLRGVAE